MVKRFLKSCMQPLINNQRPVLYHFWDTTTKQCKISVLPYFELLMAQVSSVLFQTHFMHKIFLSMCCINLQFTYLLTYLLSNQRQGTEAWVPVGENSVILTWTVFAKYQCIMNGRRERHKQTYGQTDRQTDKARQWKANFASCNAKQPALRTVVLLASGSVTCHMGLQVTHDTSEWLCTP